MRHVFAVRNEAQLHRYQEFAARIQPRLDQYIRYLKQEFGSPELPRAILWTDRETATNLLSDIPVPAYTNDYRVVFTPDLDVWQDIYLRQLDGLEENATVRAIRNYYSRYLTENHVLQILGHELAHHINLFEDGDYESGIWFEEGMVELISRRYFLTEEEYEHEARINRQLVQLLEPRYGNHSLEEFGKETYLGDYASIFFEYWRSFLAVSELASACGGDIHAVFRARRNNKRQP